MKPFPTDGMTKCEVCGRYYSPECDWRQGRCPHHPPQWERFKNLFDCIRNWLKRK